MKKSLWMLGVAVAALTSCTQNEVVEIAENRAIEFEPYVGKQSRAADVDANMLVGAAGATNDLTSFWVYATHDGEDSDVTNPFDGGDNSKVYWDEDNDSFKYDNPRQWHKGTYQFGAYSNGNSKLESGVSFNATNITFTFTDYENSGNLDLVATIPAAINKNETNMNAGVTLGFKHMLACIELEFTNNSTSYFLDFQNLKFSAYSKSTCTYSPANTTAPIAWSIPSELKEYEFITNTYVHNGSDASTNNPNVLLAPAGKAKFHCFVIPQSNSGIDLTFDIAAYTRTAQKDTDGITDKKDAQGNVIYDYVYNSTEKYKASLAITGDHNSWKPGILYRYTANVTGETHYITFFVQSVEGWTSDTNPSVDTTVTPAKPTNSGN